jgi:hypothetical protein
LVRCATLLDTHNIRLARSTRAAQKCHQECGTTPALPNLLPIAAFVSFGRIKTFQLAELVVVQT